MSALAVGTVLTIALCMWLYFHVAEALALRHMPAEVREQLVRLRADPLANAAQLWRILERYGDIRQFQPGLGNPDWLVLFFLIAVSVPIIVLIGLWASRPLSSQFTAVAHAARRVREGNFAWPVKIIPAAPEELSGLARDFNDMTTRLQQFEREVRDSSAMIAHELRTPLNAAMGRVQGMLDEVFPLNAEQLHAVYRQLEQINRLVSDLHLVSLARAGQLVLEKEEFWLRDLIAERLEWVAPRLAKAGIRVAWPMDSPVRLYADRDRIGQVVSILVENVLRYAAAGGVLDIDLRLSEEGVKIMVSDLGPGISPENLYKMRERFWRAEHSRARHSGGSGLGLAIALAISQSHGGDLECSNRSGGGMTVAACLPTSSIALPLA